jgi:hypothetical protein
MSMELGPGGVDSLRVSCPARYRIVYGRFHSVSDDSEVFFSDSFGGARSWFVGLDNSGSNELGSVTAVVACEPAGRARARSARTEQAARKQVAEAVAEHRGDDYP